MKSTAITLALAALGLGLGACFTATTPPPPLEPAPPTAGEAATAPSGGVVSSPPSLPVTPEDGASDGHRRVCHLPAARKSDDSCKADADCGPSDPCHARACVARAKSKPRTPDIMCTMMLGCDTADANRCGCFEGRCALIPPDDAAKD
jgi:hypothetical protein